MSGVLKAPPFSRTTANEPVLGSTFNNAMAQIERAFVSYIPSQYVIELLQGTVDASGTITIGSGLTLNAGGTLTGGGGGSVPTPAGLVSTNGTVLETTTLAAAFTWSADTLSLNNFGTAANGGVPVSPGGTVDFLRADGSWAVPSGGSASLLVESGASSKISALTTASNPPVASATSLLYIPTVQEDGTNAKVSISNLMIAPNAVVSSGSAGVSLLATSGSGDGAGNGGSITVTTGAGGTAGVGGALSLISGAGGAGTGTAGEGGLIALTAGNGGVNGFGGNVSITAGNTGTASTAGTLQGGTLTLSGGQGLGASGHGLGGPVIITGGSGNLSGLQNGYVSITAGNGYDPGSVTLNAGTGQAGGNIILTSGAGTALAAGTVSLVGGAGGGNTFVGYRGGNIVLQGGTGGTQPTGGPGGIVQITGGNGAATNGVGGDISFTMGSGSGTGRQGQLIVTNFPTADPSVTNAIWANNGVLVKSGSTTGVGGTVTSLVAGANISLSPSTITTTGTISASGLLIASNNLSDVSSKNLSRVNVNQGSATLVTSGATISTNAALGNVFYAPLTSGVGPYTMANPTNLLNGATYIWRIVQPGSGSTQSIGTWGSVFKFPSPYSNSSPPALTATLGATDIATGVSDGTNVYVALGQNFS